MNENVSVRNEGRDVPVQILHPSSLLNEHEWAYIPEIEPSFRMNVELNSRPRSDMARVKTITMENAGNGREIWSTMCRSRTLFRIPDPIQCDRTFARDNEEAYYVDRMDSYLKQTHENITVHEIPFVKRSLQNRRFYAFSRRNEYFREHYERRRTGIWLPHDALENKFSCEVDLRERYPTEEEWIKGISQPAALPVPVPLVVYYFHIELCRAQRDMRDGKQISGRAKRLLFCLRCEYYILFLAMWWNEAKHGGRQFVLDSNTIDTIASYCPHLPDSVELKHVQVILEYMRTASNTPESAHNWLAFRQDWMEDSPFVWADKSTGCYDPSQRPCNHTLWLDLDSRGISISERSTKLFKRSTVLDKVLCDPDLDKIPGLRAIVEEQKWYTNGNLRVGDLLANFVQIFNATRSVVDTLVRQGLSDPYSYQRSSRSNYYDRRFSDEYGPAERITYPNSSNDEHRERQSEDSFRHIVGNEQRYSPSYSGVNGSYPSRGPSDQYHRDWNGSYERSDGCKSGGGQVGKRAVINTERRHQDFPHCTPARVYELPDQTPRVDSAVMNESDAEALNCGTTTNKENCTPRGIGGATDRGAPTTIQLNKSLSASSETPAWAEQMFKATALDQLNRKDVATGFRPSTPFLQGDTPKRTEVPNDSINRNCSKVDVAAVDDTRANNDDGEEMTSAHFVQQGTGNVPWCAAKKRFAPENTAREEPPMAEHKQQRVDKSDAVLCGLMTRHPANTAYEIALHKRSQDEHQRN